MSTTSILQVESLIAAMVERAQRNASSTAFGIEGDLISYERLHDGAKRVAAGLAAHGIERGDHCALLMPTSPEFLFALFGAQLLGAPPVAINAKLPLAAILRRVKQADCRVLICPGTQVSDLTKSAEEAQVATKVLAVEDLISSSPSGAAGLPLPEAGAISHLQFTSGTSGDARAAMLTHANVIASLEYSLAHMRPVPDDVLVSWVPLHHDLGLIRFGFWPVFTGLPAHLIEPAITNLDHWLKTVSKVRGTITGCPDFGYRIAARIVDPAGLDLTSLRIATNGGEPVRYSTVESFENRFGLQGIVRPGYGLAEVTLGVTGYATEDKVRVDPQGHVSSGKPYPSLEVKIVGDDGQALPAGEVGEIAVAGVPVFVGYYNDPHATAEVLRDGWLYTGDSAYMDSDRYVFVLGRRRAMIKRAGALIAPREVEELVDGVDGVRLSAAVGVPRESLGGTEDVVVVAEARPELTSDAEQARKLARQIATRVREGVGYAPLDVLLVAPRTIARTHNGKIRHAKMRELITSGRLHEDGVILYGGETVRREKQSP